MEGRSSRRHHQSSRNHHRYRGYTLVEIVTVALVLSILACIAVPRLGLDAALSARADAAVRRLVTDLRHTRALAITNAARNPDGFALVLQGDGPDRGYQIINQYDHKAVTTCTLAAGVQCRGGPRFEFGPLGNLQNGSETRLRLQTEGKAYRIEIAPATGAVEWHPCSDNE